VSIREKIVKKL